MFALYVMAALLSVFCRIGIVISQCVVEELLARELVLLELLVDGLQLGQLRVVKALETVAATPGEIRITAQGVGVELHDRFTCRAIALWSLDRHCSSYFLTCPWPVPFGRMPTVRSRRTIFRNPRSSVALMPRRRRRPIVRPRPLANPRPRRPAAPIARPITPGRFEPARVVLPSLPVPAAILI